MTKGILYKEENRSIIYHQNATGRRYIFLFILPELVHSDLTRVCTTYHSSILLCCVHTSRGFMCIIAWKMPESSSESSLEKNWFTIVDYLELFAEWEITFPSLQPNCCLLAYLVWMRPKSSSISLKAYFLLFWINLYNIVLFQLVSSKPTVKLIYRPSVVN